MDHDLVLVLDVSESYRPWLVTSQRRYEAMDTFDTATSKERGLILRRSRSDAMVSERPTSVEAHRAP